MNLSSHLFAEQSIFARLVVRRIPPNITDFQRRTKQDDIDNNDDDVKLKLYDYYATSDAEPLTKNSDPANYSITSLPDTLAYLPRYSIFDLVRLIDEADQDYRKLYVNSGQELLSLNDKPLVMTKATPSVLKHNSTQAALDSSYTPTTSIFSNRPPQALLRKETKNFSDSIKIDERFSNLNENDLYAQLGSLTVTLTNLSQPTSQKSENVQEARKQIYDILNISSDVQSYVGSVTAIDPLKKNADIVKAYITKRYISSTAKVDNENAQKMAKDIDNFVNTYGIITEANFNANNPFATPPSPK